MYKIKLAYRIRVPQSNTWAPGVIDDLVRGRVQGRNTGENRQGHFTSTHRSSIRQIWSVGYVAHVTCSLSAHATHTCTRIFKLDQKSWLGNEEKGHASTNRCLALRFLEGLSIPPFEIHGFLSAVVSPRLARKRIAILAAFVDHKRWSKRAWSLGDMGWGFNQPGVALHTKCLSFGFGLVSLLFCAWPVMLWLQQTKWTKLCLVRRAESDVFRLLCCDE